MDNILVGILMGSKSDAEVMLKGKEILDELEIGSEVRILSAHRTPKELHEYVEKAPKKGVKIFIAGAGMSAHLAGVVGASTNLPVIGVPINSSSLGGVDALLSTIQMPPGIPVATMGIGSAGARNAALFAARILALEDSKISERYNIFVEKQKQKVLDSDRSIQNN
ncbi:MAG: 5-(carboxyamino)imidazole ribonucleotide mutase [Nitrospinae bacterium]|nr:5-(carboxyamino)imidazole ribonucleotide mutase [Nitrospinota bacterium]|tara:strand:- start:478 stop:975 length:498 start_codon:yes stop_codon:yes gene_type:complete